MFKILSSNAINQPLQRTWQLTPLNTQPESAVKQWGDRLHCNFVLFCSGYLVTSPRIFRAGSTQQLSVSLFSVSVPWVVNATVSPTHGAGDSIASDGAQFTGTSDGLLKLKVCLKWSITSSSCTQTITQVKLHMSHRQPTVPEVNAVSVAWGNWEYYCSPLAGILVHHRVTPAFCKASVRSSHKNPCTYSPGWKETMWSKVSS